MAKSNLGKEIIYFNLHFQGITHHWGKQEQSHKNEETTKKCSLLAYTQIYAQLDLLKDSVPLA